MCKSVLFSMTAPDLNAKSPGTSLSGDYPTICVVFRLGDHSHARVRIRT